MNFKGRFVRIQRHMNAEKKKYEQQRLQNRKGKYQEKNRKEKYEVRNHKRGYQEKHPKRENSVWTRPV